MHTQYAPLVEEMTLPLLTWAWHKTGTHAAAEDLAQEVWLQFFRTVQREEKEGRAVQEPEHLLWRVAKLVWYKSLRQTCNRNLPLDEQAADPADFAAEMADAQEREQWARWVHGQVLRMGRIQREAIVLYYIEQWPQRRIAAHLGISEGALRWHLHNTRQRLKKGADHMTNTDRVYRPHELCLGIFGTGVPDIARQRVHESLLMQNILICSHRAARTIPEMAELLGVATPYIEHDVEWLVSQEYLVEEKGRYGTAFLIQDAQLEKAMLNVIARHKEGISGAIAQRLLAREAQIRDLGFIGCDRPMDRLLWWLLYHCCASLRHPVDVPTPPLRPDGGQYFIRAFDRTIPAEGSLIDGWCYNGSMLKDGFHWFGLYNFGESDIERLMDGWTPAWAALRELLKRLIEHDFDMNIVSADEQPLLAELVQKGFLRMEAGHISPTFCILTEGQYARLRKEVLEPIQAEVEPRLTPLAADLLETLRNATPERLHGQLTLETAMALRDLSFVTERLAFDDGLLYRPADKADGEFLTLFYIRK